MKTRCTYEHHDGSVYGGLWPHERLAISAFIDYNDKNPLLQIIKLGDCSSDTKPRGIKSEGMGYFIDDYLDGAIKRPPRTKATTKALDFDIWHEVDYLMTVRALTLENAAAEVAERYGVNEKTAEGAYTEIKQLINK